MPLKKLARADRSQVGAEEEPWVGWPGSVYIQGLVAWAAPCSPSARGGVAQVEDQARRPGCGRMAQPGEHPSSGTCGWHPSTGSAGWGRQARRRLRSSSSSPCSCRSRTHSQCWRWSVVQEGAGHHVEDRLEVGQSRRQRARGRGHSRAASPAGVTCCGSS
jgi:hypothetical protein